MSALPVESQENPLDAILASVNDLAVLPQVVFKIMESTGDADASSAADLEKQIIVDPGFSAKVLKMANSAHFALPKKVTNIREAVQFLGFRQVRQLAMNAGVFDMFVGKNDKESLRRRAWWRHSLDAAVCCRWMATHFKELSPDEAYTAGLLHLIGKTILDKSNSELYNTVMAAQERGVPDRVAEAHFYSCDHAQVTAGVCAKWGLPNELVQAMNYPEPDAENRLRACVAISHTVAHLAIAGVSEDQELPSLFYTWAVESLNVADNLKEWLDAGIAAIAANRSTA